MLGIIIVLEEQLIIYSKTTGSFVSCHILSLSSLDLFQFDHFRAISIFLIFISLSADLVYGRIVERLMRTSLNISKGKTMLIGLYTKLVLLVFDIIWMICLLLICLIIFITFYTLKISYIWTLVLEILCTLYTVLYYSSANVSINSSIISKIIPIHTIDDDFSIDIIRII